MTTLTPTRLIQALDRTDSFLVVARLSLLLLLVNAHHDIPVLLFSAAACAVMFLNERLLRSPWPWLLVAGVLGASQLVDWWLIDNHRFATTSWLAILGLSRLADEPKRALDLGARAFVVVLFTFAFGWKLLSPQYTTGDFFRYALLRDARFEPVVTLVAGADEEQLERDRAAVIGFTENGRLDETIEVVERPRMDALARVFTFWGLALEGAIALVFLVPLRGRTRLLRPSALLLFVATTYAVAPVVGFGLLLMTLGLAQADTRWLRRTYVAGSVAVFAWGALLIELIL